MSTVGCQSQSTGVSSTRGFQFPPSAARTCAGWSSFQPQATTSAGGLQSLPLSPQCPQERSIPVLGPPWHPLERSTSDLHPPKHPLKGSRSNLHSPVGLCLGLSPPSGQGLPLQPYFYSGFDGNHQEKPTQGSNLASGSYCTFSTIDLCTSLHTLQSMLLLIKPSLKLSSVTLHFLMEVKLGRTSGTF